MGPLRGLWFELPTWKIRWLVFEPRPGAGKMFVAPDAVYASSRDARARRVDAARERGGGNGERPDRHLLSADTLVGCRVAAYDGDVGTVTDFLVEEPGWSICGVVVLPEVGGRGRPVALSTSWVAAADWPTARLSLEVDRATARDSPVIDPDRPVDQATTERLRLHFRRPVPGTSTPPSAVT